MTPYEEYLKRKKQNAAQGGTSGGTVPTGLSPFQDYLQRRQEKQAEVLKRQHGMAIRPTTAVAENFPASEALLQTQEKAEELWNRAVDRNERYKGYEEQYQDGASWSGVSSNISKAQTKIGDLDSQIEDLQMQIELAEDYLNDPTLTYAPRDGRDGREVAQEEITAWKYAWGALETEKKVLQSQLDGDNELYSYLWGRTFSDMAQDEAYGENVEKGKQRYKKAEEGYKKEVAPDSIADYIALGLTGDNPQNADGSLNQQYFAAKDYEEEQRLFARGHFPIYISIAALTQEEQDNFYYLLGVGRDDMARAYVNEITNQKNRESLEKINQWAGTNTGTRFLSSVASVAATMLPSAALGDMTLPRSRKALTGLDESSYVGFGGAKDALRSGVAEGLTEKGLFNTGFLAGTADLPVVGEKSIGDVYSLGMSAADSAVAGALFGPAGASLVLGSSATSSAFNNAMANGASYEQALTQGLAQGTAEIIFEKISLEALFGDSLGGIKNKILKALAQGGIEASEELATSVSNLITDQWIMGEKSEYNRLVQYYKSNGWTEEAAKEKAEKDIWQGLMTDAIGGFISGAGMSGGYSAINAIANRNSGENSKAPAAAASSEQPVQQDSTAINDDPATHTAEEMRVIEEYKNSTDGSLRNLFSSLVDRNAKTFLRHKISNVSQRQSEDASRLLGGNYSGYTNNINTNGARHIMKEHGPNGTVDHSLGDLDDASRIGYVLDTYDNVEAVTYESGDYDTSAEFRNANNEPAKMLRYSKKVNGTYYVVEAIPESQYKKFWVVSAYMQKEADDFTQARDAQSPASTPKASLASQSSAKGGSSAQLLNMEDNSSPQSTPQTPAGMATSAKDSIAQSGGAVNTDEGLVYEILLDMGVHKAAAESLAGNFDSKEGMPAELFARGIGEAFLYGMSNFSTEEMAQRGSLSADLSEQQRNYAYEMGKIFRKDQIADREKTIQQEKKAAEKASTTQKKGSVQFEDSKIKEENLTELQKVSVEALKKLAEASGVNFYLYQSEKGTDGRPIGDNGWYDHKTGDIHIDLNAGDFGDGTILFTAAHELSHFLHQWSPSKFKTLADFLAVQYGKNGQSVTDLIQLQQDKAWRNGRSLSWMQAYEEMVADSMETMLTDGNVMERLAELRARDKSLVEKIKEWFQDFAAKIKKAYKDLKPDTQEGRMVAEMADAAQRLQELFAEGLAEAGENYRAVGGQKNNTAQEDDVKYSLRNGLKADLEKVKNRTFDSSKGEVEIGNTSDFMVNELKADPLVMYMPPTKAYRAMVTEEQAIKDGQPTGDDINYHGLGVDGLYELLEKSEHPIAAFVAKQSEKDSRFDRIVLVTDSKIGQGLGVAIVEVNTMARGHGKQMQANKTITAYDKNNAVTAVQEAFDGGRLLYIDKKNGQLFNSGRKGSNCPTTISESVRNQNIQDFWANVKWKKTGKQEMSFSGNQKQPTAFAEALQRAQQKADSDNASSARGNITTRSVLTELDVSTVENDIERNHLLEYQENSRKQLQEQKKLDELQSELDTLQAETGRKDTKRISFLKDEIIKTKNRIGNYAGMLQREENGWQLEKLIQREVKAALAKAVDKYGAIPAGERAAEDRTVEMPRSMDGKTKISRVARSAAEAQMTPKEFAPKIEQAVVDGLLSYDPDTNKKQMERAQVWLESKGSSGAVRTWMKDVAKKGKLSRDDVARGILLYNNLCNAANTATSAQERMDRAREAVEVLSDIQNMVTESAQMVQAMRLMKKQAPEMQYYALEQSVQKINDELGDKLPDGVKINETLADRWMQALRNGDEAEIEAAAQALYRDIAAQVPKTFMDKWNAWRYLCMLGNPKTMIRNIAGNALFAPVKATRDFIGGVIEGVSSKFGWIDQQERTKSVKVLNATEEGRKLLKFAKDDYKTVEKIASGSGKYNDQSGASSELQEAIQEAKREFSLWGVRHWQKATDWAMDNELFGDFAFLRHHYKTAFAHAAAARGYTAEQIQNGEISQAQLDQLRAYAIKQAQKATYRDVNAFSSALRKLRFKGDGFGARMGNVFIEGVLPFKSTPANVLVRAVEYSPVGLLKAISADVVSLKKGNITAAEYIERLSSGLTGSLVYGLGILMSSFGRVVGGNTDEDDDRIGRQSYSLKFGDSSITLDWLAPAAIPFFMGVETQKLLEEEQNVSVFSAIMNSIGTAVSPMLEMSMLSGLQDMIDTVTYQGEESSTGQIMYAFFAQPFLSYLSQAIPTLSSQTANTLETEDEFTYVGDIGDQMGRNFTRSLVKIAEKVPGADFRQEPYVDTYGRTQDKGAWYKRALNAFLNPAYTETLRITELDKEIERLEEATGEEISPTRRDYTITVDGERIRLTGDQYTAYATAYGQQYASMVGVLMNSDLYAGMTDAEKAAAIKDINGIANEYGKEAAGVGYSALSGQHKALFELAENGVPLELAFDQQLREDRLSVESGDTNVRSIQKWEAIVKNPDLSEAQKVASLQAGMSEKQRMALNTCVGAEISAAQFVEITRAKDTFGNGNGSWTQDELREYLDRSYYSKKQKAVIWEVFGSDWKVNPYK